MKDFAWLDEIESDLKHFEHTNINWTEEAMPKLIQTVKVMREALEFYANNKNYRYIIGADCTSVDIDAGDTARAALETKHDWSARR